MEFQAKKLTITSDPEMFGKMTKIKVSRPKFKKERGQWVSNGEDLFDMVGYDEIGTALMMEAVGVVIDVKGKVNQKEVTGKNGNTWRANNFVITSYTHNDD
jgi:hypothetical protein